MPRPAKGPRLWFDKSAGHWFVRDGAIKRSTGCALERRAEAEAALSLYLTRKYEPVRDSRTAKVLVSDVLIFYRREYVPAQKSPHSSNTALRAIAFWWSGKTLADVKRSTCQAYMRWRMGQRKANAKTPETLAKTVKQGTAARDLAILRAAIRAYHAENTLDALPVVWVPQASPARTRWLTRSEAAAFLWATRSIREKQARVALVRFIMLGLYTGTRSGSLRSLQWVPNSSGGWVDLRKGVIHRKGEEQDETKKRRPPARIPRRLGHFLRRWHKADQATNGPPILHLVHYQGKGLVKQEAAWKTACLAAGLGPDVIPHTLRHTAVTWMLHAGIKPWDVASYVGMSVQMLDKVYGHHHPDFQAEIADKVGRRPV